MSSHITNIVRLIRTNQIDQVCHNLSAFPLLALAQDDRHYLLNMFLTIIGRCPEVTDKILVARKILQIFIQACQTRDQIPPYVSIFNYDKSDEIIYDLIIESLAKDFYDYYLPLINAVNIDEDDLIKLSEKLTKYLVIDWNKLVELTEDDEDIPYHNLKFKQYLIDTAAKNIKTIDTQEWIKELPELDQTLTFDYKAVPNVNDAVNLLIKEMTKLNLVVEDAKTLQTEDITSDTSLTRELLSKQYAVAPLFEKYNMIKHLDVTAIKVNDIPAFNEYGPLNSLTNGEPCDTCAKVGGCRMLLCNEFETYNNDHNDLLMDDSDIIESDWFNGSCDVCNAIITDRIYAVRRPLVNGGWLNCYCGIDCLLKEVESELDKAMISNLCEQLLTYGIRKR